MEELTFKIAATPSDASGWTHDNCNNPLATLENDMRCLMKELAESRAAAAGQQAAAMERQRKLFLRIAEVIDAFDRVLNNIMKKEDQLTPQMKIWLSNIRTVYKLLTAILTENEVVAIEIPAHGFDPHVHLVAELVEDPTKPDGAIIEELAKGYIWKEQILRKAGLKVNKNESLSVLQRFSKGDIG